MKNWIDLASEKDFVLIDSLHYATTCSTYLNFLHSEVNQLIQHIIVQDQDGQNNNTEKDYWRALVNVVQAISLMFTVHKIFIRPKNIKIKGKPGKV